MSGLLRAAERITTDQRKLGLWGVIGFVVVKREKEWKQGKKETKKERNQERKKQKGRKEKEKEEKEKGREGEGKEGKEKKRSYKILVLYFKYWDRYFFEDTHKYDMHDNCPSKHGMFFDHNLTVLMSTDVRCVFSNIRHLVCTGHYVQCLVIFLHLILLI